MLSTVWRCCTACQHCETCLASLSRCAFSPRPPRLWSMCTYFAFFQPAGFHAAYSGIIRRPAPAVAALLRALHRLQLVGLVHFPFSLPPLCDEPWLCKLNGGVQPTQEAICLRYPALLALARSLPCTALVALPCPRRRRRPPQHARWLAQSGARHIRQYAAVAPSDRGRGMAALRRAGVAFGGGARAGELHVRPCPAPGQCPPCASYPQCPCTHLHSCRLPHGCARAWPALLHLPGGSIRHFWSRGWPRGGDPAPAGAENAQSR